MTAKRWKEIRTYVLNRQPICVDCYANGISTAATELHHVKPVETAVNMNEAKLLCYDIKNIVALCHRCHVQRHVELHSKSKEVLKQRKEAATQRFIDHFLK